MVKISLFTITRLCPIHLFLHARRETKFNTYNHIFLEGCDRRRTLLENEKERSSKEAKHFLDRGDSKIFDSRFPKTRELVESNSVWQTNCALRHQISMRTSPARCNLRQRKNKRSLTSTKGYYFALTMRMSPTFSNSEL